MGAAVLLGIALAASTDFIGDDHVFLAWSRYAPSPWAAWFSDVHGGEYYRPIPLLWWWCLGRLGGGHALPFACFMAGGHAWAAHLVARVLRAAGESTAVARGAAAVFFLAPSQIDAVSWYAASTDLLACLGVLGALLAVSRGRDCRGRRFFYLGYLAFALCAKESAVILPLILILWARFSTASAPQSSVLTRDACASQTIHRPFVLRVREACARHLGARASWAVAGPALALAVVYLFVRRHVLDGWGGAGDPLQAPAARLIALVWAVPVWLSGTPTTVDPIVAGLLGGAVLLLLLVLARLPAATRWEMPDQSLDGQAHAGSAFSRSVATPLPLPFLLSLCFPFPLLPLSFAALSLLPLLAVSEPGARRYTYLAAFPLSWLVARVLFAQGRRKLGGLVLLLLLASSAVQLAGRARQIAQYRDVVRAARRAVATALSQGHHLVHLAAGIKDLDLAVKEDESLAAARHEILVLSDVPASFAFLPEEDQRTLLARPPLPPSGAYRFGPERLVGLARRGAEPTLEEAFARWPDLRLLRPCVAQPPHRAAFCDVTSAHHP